MPTIRMNKKRFIKLLGKRLDDDELSYYISMIGTDLEDITPEDIIVEVFPNRPDMLSEEGFARAMRYFLGLEENIKTYNVKKSNYQAKVEEGISRNYVGCAVVKNVKFDEDAFRSLIELQEKLHITHGRKRSIASIGVHNLDVIEFPITYKKVDENFSFIPLGYEKEMTMKEILEKHEKGKAYKHLVKNYEVWVDNKGNVLAFPPIINAQYTAIDEKTQNFFIDVTGTNKRVVEEMLNIVVTHLVELEGEVYNVYVNNTPYPMLEYRQKTIDIDYVNKLLGLNLSHNYVKDLLLKMGMGFKYKDEKRFNVLIPPYRTDILHDMDVVEDIAISYGYDKFSSTLPNIFTIGKISYKTKFENILRDILVGLGALEVITYHLSNENILYKNMMIKKYSSIKVIHPMNEEYDTLRNSIFPLLLDFLSKNKRYPYPQFVFEIGNVFNNNGNEKTRLAFVYANTKAKYEDVKSIIDAVFRELGLAYKVDKSDSSFLIKGRAAKILVNEEEIGWFGEVHPEVLINFDLEVPVIGGEIDVEELEKKIEK